MANYSFGIKSIPDVENGHTFTGDNFTQLLPHTKILEGKSGLKFINCNLTNCDAPSDSTFKGCKPSHISFCTNERPNLIEHGLAPCAVNCEHLLSTDMVTIDGQIVDTVNYYEAKGVT